MQFPVRSALLSLVSNGAPLIRPSSTYKSGNVVLTSGAISGPPTPPLWRRHDLSEAAASRAAGNHKRVERLYTKAGLQVRHQRKKVPVADRQTLGRPLSAHQVWSMDFVFDRTAEGRVIKCLTVVDDATHEAVAIVLERAIGGHALTCILDRWPWNEYCHRRSAPTTVRSSVVMRCRPGRVSVA